MKCNLHTLEFTHGKGTIQWLLVSFLSHAAFITVQFWDISITQEDDLCPPTVNPWLPSPLPCGHCSSSHLYWFAFPGNCIEKESHDLFPWSIHAIPHICHSFLFIPNQNSIARIWENSFDFRLITLYWFLFSFQGLGFSVLFGKMSSKGKVMNISSDELVLCMFWESGANSHCLQVDPRLVEKWIYPFHVDLAPWKKIHEP